jgi:hypothetical protein
MSFSVNGADLSYMKVYGMFAESTWGQKLAVSSRWGRFKPMHMPSGEWQGLLGVDVNNLKHMKLSYGHTRWFLNGCETPTPVWQGDVPEEAKFSLQEKQLLLLVPVFHDIAEAVNGDIPYPDKNTLDDELEVYYLHSIAKAVAVHNPDLLCVLEKGIDTILRDTTSKLGEAFRTIEIFGYHCTAIHAWRRSILSDMAHAPEVKRSLRGIALSVHTHNLNNLILRARIYPPILKHLTENAEIIDTIYKMAPSTAARLIHTYEGMQTIKNLEAEYFGQRTAWRRWRSEHPGMVRQLA